MCSCHSRGRRCQVAAGWGLCGLFRWLITSHRYHRFCKLQHISPVVCFSRKNPQIYNLKLLPSSWLLPCLLRSWTVCLQMKKVTKSNFFIGPVYKWIRKTQNIKIICYKQILIADVSMYTEMYILLVVVLLPYPSENILKWLTHLLNFFYLFSAAWLKKQNKKETWVACSFYCGIRLPYLSEK